MTGGSLDANDACLAPRVLATQRKSAISEPMANRPWMTSRATRNPLTCLSLQTDEGPLLMLAFWERRVGDVFGSGSSWSTDPTKGCGRRRWSVVARWELFRGQPWLALRRGLVGPLNTTSCRVFCSAVRDVVGNLSSGVRNTLRSATVNDAHLLLEFCYFNDADTMRLQCQSGYRRLKGRAVRITKGLD